MGKEDGGGDLRQQRKFQIQQQNCFLYVLFSYFFMQLWIFTYFILFLFSICLTLAIKIYNQKHNVNIAFHKKKLKKMLIKANGPLKIFIAADMLLHIN